MILSINNAAAMRVFALLAVVTMVTALVPFTALATALETEISCLDSEENLLSNPSFEDEVAVDSNSYAVLSSIPSWDSTGDFEIWNNMFGGASDGAQNLELDVDSPTTVSQEVDTVEGNEYLVMFDLGARPGVSSNEIDLIVDEETLGTVSSDGTGNEINDWTSHSFTFIAAGQAALIEFSDMGDSDSLGSLLNNARVCLVADNAVYTTSVGGQKWNDEDGDGYWDEGENGQDGVTITITDDSEFSTTTVTTDGGYYSFGNLPTDTTYFVCEEVPAGAVQTYPVQDEENSSVVSCQDNGNGYSVTPVGEGSYELDFGNYEENTYEIFGFIFNDEDEDDAIEEGETRLDGWKVTATEQTEGEARVFTTTSDENGRYELAVPAGTWRISQEVEESWEQLTVADTEGDYIVTVPAPVEEEEFIISMLMNWIIPTAHAAVISDYIGPKNFGNEYVGSNNGGGTRVGSRSGSSSNAPSGSVLGASTSTPTVLGDATTTMPVGAPNTGAGGTASTATVVATLQTATFRRLSNVRN